MGSWMIVDDRQWMREALKLARNGIGTTHPNPRVGAVVVRERDGRLLGKGWHKAPGGPHAEVVALAQAGGDANGATLYVTLEPCSGFGRTPPCTEAIVAAGIRRVVFGSADSNPAMAGGGQQLVEQGIEVRRGVLQAECDLLNRPFFHGLRHQRPWIIAKAALSLDGKLATADGDSRWISNNRCRRHAHRLRAEVDAVIVGAGTLRSDNPQLTPRGVKRNGDNPLRVVISRTLPVFRADLQLADVRDAATRIYCQTVTADALHWRAAGVEVVQYQQLRDLFFHLYEAGVRLVLVEGGGRLHGALLRAQLVDEVVLYQAAMLIGGDAATHLWGGDGCHRIADAPRLINVQYRRMLDNQLIRGDLLYPSSL